MTITGFPSRLPVRSRHQVWQCGGLRYPVEVYREELRQDLHRQEPPDALQDNAITPTCGDPESPVVQTANGDDDDEYKSDASDGYSSDGSVYIDEGAESNDGSDEDENGDMTDDNSDFEQEEGLVQDGNDIDEEDDANEGNRTESSESEEEVESPAPVNKTAGRNLQKAPSSANKTPVSRVRAGRVIKSGTATSGTPLKCPVRKLRQDLHWQELPFVSLAPLLRGDLGVKRVEAGFITRSWWDDVLARWG
jgi:hypothetical protein